MWVPAVRLPRVKLTRVRLTRVRLPRVQIIIEGKITLGKLIIIQDKDKVTQGKCIQGKYKVIQVEFNPGMFKYPGKVTLGRITWGKINLG